MKKGGDSMKFVKMVALTASLGFFVIGMTTSALAKSKYEEEVETEQVAVKLVREVKRGGYQVVTAEELNQWIEAGKDMLIIDTMPYEDSYKKIHVPGAKQFLFPIPEMTTWDTNETNGMTREDFKTFLGADTNKVIVIYCGFVKCGRSHNGAAWAVKLGYTNVYRFPGGIFAWRGADYDTERVD
jgi:thiosulfate/3-mercaptopyruvate sulfurtransferase